MSTPPFVDAIDGLSPDDFIRHFASRNTVRYPEPPPAAPAVLASANRVLENRFALTGEEHELPDGFSWKHNPSGDVEWQIAHHKFYFAIDLVRAYRHTGDRAYLDRWVHLLGTWLAEMGSGFVTASDAQVEAKRVEHWVQSFMLLRGTPWASIVPSRFLRDFLVRIATETCYIAEHLRPVRNHRTFQLFAVFMVGVLFPEFRQQPRFLELGRRELTKNLLTDFLEDGVHVELSTHYHQLVLETALAFVELARLNDIALDPALASRLGRALEFSMHVQLPDGGIPLLNDSDNGDHRGMLALGGRLFEDARLSWAATLGRAGTPPGERARHFDRAGYFVLSDGWAVDPTSYARRQHVVYDCGGLGEGSHSHYDLFSFTYFLGGAPAIIDPGRYTYSARPDADGIDWRHRFKATGAHNTVTIDGRDQTRYISKHTRPPRTPGVPRAKHGMPVEILDATWYLGAETDWVRATARSVEYTPRHRRLFVFFRRRYLFVLDEVLVDEDAAHECVLRLHLAPRWLDEVTLDGAVVRTPLFDIRTLAVRGAGTRLAPGWASETYGVKTPAPVLEVTRSSSRSLWFCSVIAPRAAAGYGIETHAVQLEREDDEVLIVRVDGAGDDATFTDRFFAARGARPARLESPFGVMTARFMAWRQRADGAVVYVCARDAVPVGGAPSMIRGEPWPPVAATPAGDVEWTAPGQLADAAASSIRR